VLLVKDGMPNIPTLLAELVDAPDESIAVALADAIFHLEHSTDDRLLFCLGEADVVRDRLKLHGFDIISVAAVAQADTTESDHRLTTAEAN
jgi:hypothetical protein